MSKHQLTDHRCCILLCTARPPRYSVAAGMYLCQEHMLRAWSLVQKDIDAGKVPATPLKRTLTPDVELPKYPGDVYYLRVGNHIKIGYSKDVEQRLAVYPPDSELIALREGTKHLERAEHQRYADHLAYGREWFTYSDELRDDITHDVAGRPHWYLDDDFEECDGEENRPAWQRRRAKKGSPVRLSVRKAA